MRSKLYSFHALLTFLSVKNVEVVLAELAAIIAGRPGCLKRREFFQRPDLALYISRAERMITPRKAQ
jgi:hypothetical protein